MTTPPHPVLGRAARTAPEIVADLRREYQEQWRKEGKDAFPDPVLMVLFHALGVQVERIYRDAERRFPEAVLDDLVAGLGMPPRLAQPAQAVVRFRNIELRERVDPDTQLQGYTRTGEPLGFAPDEGIELSPTALVFAAVHEEGRLHALPGGELAGGPAVATVPAAAPTLYLAFDPDAAHLGGLGLFVDTDGVAAEALARAPWQLLDERGCVFEDGMMRAHPGRGGVRRLGWLRDPVPPAGADSGAARALAIPAGAYGARIFIFPPIPPERRFRSGIPPAIREAAPLLVAEDEAGALERPLAWVQVPLPAGMRGVADAVHQVVPHCVTASNVEGADEVVWFDLSGTRLDFRPEGRRDAHVVGVLSVTGEYGGAYVEESSVDAAPRAGRWRYRAGSFDLRAARYESGRSDHYAVLRLLHSRGEKGNGVGVGQVCRISAELTNATLQVASLTVSRGGSDPPAYPAARERFCELLRSRERVVTAADVEAAARAFEPRVAAVEVESRAEAAAGHVARVVRVTARVRPGDFLDPEADLPRLGALLEEHLRARAVLGLDVRARVEALP